MQSISTNNLFMHEHWVGNAPFPPRFRGLCPRAPKIAVRGHEMLAISAGAAKHAVSITGCMKRCSRNAMLRWRCYGRDRPLCSGDRISRW